MSSGWSPRGTRPRCYHFWRDLVECTDREPDLKKCVLFRDDYLECLHGKKERTMKQEILDQEKRKAQLARYADGHGGGGHH